jgi:hypothetical protein
MNGSRTVTTSTREGSKPISSVASLKAVSTSSASPSSLFPPGKETSPAIEHNPFLLSLKHHIASNTSVQPSKKDDLIVINIKKNSLLYQNERKVLKSVLLGSHADLHHILQIYI